MGGLLIDFEGIDGSGTETQSKLLQQRFRERHRIASLYRYPDLNSAWGHIVDDFLHKRVDIDARTQFLTFAADICKDQERIAKALAQGTTIITDRYVTSTVAYQCSKGMPLQSALAITDALGFVAPDLIVLLDVPVETSMQRKQGEKGALDRHESDKRLLEAVRGAYLKLAAEKRISKNWLVVDGRRSREEICDEVAAHVEKMLER